MSSLHFFFIRVDKHEKREQHRATILSILVTPLAEKTHTHSLKTPDDDDDRRTTRLSDQGRGSGGLVLEGRGQLLLLDVVTSETVDPGLDENESAVVRRGVSARGCRGTVGQRQRDGEA